MGVRVVDITWHAIVDDMHGYEGKLRIYFKTDGPNSDSWTEIHKKFQEMRTAFWDDSNSIESLWYERLYSGVYAMYFRRKSTAMRFKLEYYP